jgi:hypothetical protein
VATPASPFLGKDDCLDCTSLKKDRRTDLVLHFEARDLVAALGSPTADGCYVLPLTGSQRDGCPILGEDVVRLRPNSARLQPMPADIAPGTALLSSLPNPFRQQTRITFGMPQAGRARLAIYDVVGREVRVLVDEPREAGTHSTDWDGTDRSGSRVARGLYFSRLTITPSTGSEETIVRQEKLILGR